MENTYAKMNTETQTKNIGYTLSIIGTALILIWLGVFKYTPTEAAVIQVFVENHPLMSWMYDVMSLQTVSNIVGTAEIIVGIGFIISLFNPKFGLYAGIAGVAIFVTTLSFAFTTPGIFKVVDGVPITEFFLLKDIMYLAASIMLIEKSKA